MKALPKKCDANTIKMRQFKDLNKLELHDLFADINTYEFDLGIRIEEDPLNPQLTKSLAIAEESSSRKSSDYLGNDAMSLFVKKFENLTERIRIISKL